MDLATLALFLPGGGAADVGAVVLRNQDSGSGVTVLPGVAVVARESRGWGAGEYGQGRFVGIGTAGIFSGGGQARRCSI